MKKGELLVLMSTIVVVVGIISFFYGSERNKLSAKKGKAAVKVKDGMATRKHKLFLGKKEIKDMHSITKSQGSKEEQCGALAEVSERQAKQREYELNKEFEEEAKEMLPLLSIQTNNPLDTKAFGPQRGEIWVRVKPDNARELKQIMEELAELYRSRTGYEGSITIMHWVGGRPHLKMTFHANGEKK